MVPRGATAAARQGIPLNAANIAPLRLESHFVPVPRDLRRYLPRLTYLLLDERRLDLDRPELRSNPTAALFKFETNETLEAISSLQELRKLGRRVLRAKSLAEMGLE